MKIVCDFQWAMIVAAEYFLHTISIVTFFWYVSSATLKEGCKTARTEMFHALYHPEISLQNCKRVEGMYSSFQKVVVFQIKKLTSFHCPTTALITSRRFAI